MTQELGDRPASLLGAVQIARSRSLSDKIGPLGKEPGGLTMRIGSRILLVGGIPIVVAALIALAALLLMREAERARSGAVLAGAIYRNLTVAMTERGDYIDALPNEREMHRGRFDEASNRARLDLQELGSVVRGEERRQDVADARRSLAEYMQDMDRLVAVTVNNDALIWEMNARADALITLTDQARERQHASNSDIVASLADRDRTLRYNQDILQRAQELSAVIAAVELGSARLYQAHDAWETATIRQNLGFDRARLDRTSEDLADALDAGGEKERAAQLRSLAGADPTINPADATGRRRSELLAWLDRLLKVRSAELRTLQDEVAELLTYSVKAHETEQATQNIAITTLKLGGRTADALASRDPDAASAILRESQALSETLARLPISPLIQTEMIDAIDQWRQHLSTTVNGLKAQNELIAGMDGTAAQLIADARRLDATLSEDGERIGDLIRTVLILGAAIGLLLGGMTGLAVARSITKPLGRLQQGMMQLAANTQAGPIADTDRRDEIGDMARATNIFVTEIRRREQALRNAKDRADNALTELQRTQSELIQAEKMASLGQLVAGVAHEINTPLGIALTTSTLMRDEVKEFGDAAAAGRLPRSVFERFVARTREGSALLLANLTRAADLVHSFKQVAADHASGEMRRFVVKTWLADLLTSLTPVIRKSGHEVTMECPEGLEAETYPGALAQVLTNLLMNAVTHAYRPGQTGHISIRISEERPNWMRIVFSDDGRGIDPENLGKVFDPFFTTGRSAGSTGLGLHIVYNLVTSTLDGRLDLDSELGEGTRFTIDLPRMLAAAEASAPAAERLARVS